MQMKDSIFGDFLGKNVKVPYIDGRNLKVARGKLEAIGDGFLKLKGDLGVIIINLNNIQKVTCLDGNGSEMGCDSKCNKKTGQEALA